MEEFYSIRVLYPHGFHDLQGYSLFRHDGGLTIRGLVQQRIEARNDWNAEKNGHETGSSSPLSSRWATEIGIGRIIIGDKT